MYSGNCTLTKFDMKKATRSIIVFALMIFPAISNLVLGDPPAPPNPGGSPVGTGTPVGAPVDNGILILLALGVIYGAYKIYELKKRVKSLEEPTR